ncbi:hypothetical protein [Microtetraspora fusca]|uniref:Uncharacterized protein n=1 Tax=Microtetraspora fusca TaxID=1997 RepID=A0ABW6VN34_MICFU|nr:hypothetical protein [Microtetraspora fusca]
MSSITQAEELLESLVVDTQALGHRLHRLAAAVQQQAPQVGQPFGPLIPAGQRSEHLRSEGLQLLPDMGKVLGGHARIAPLHPETDQPQKPDPTKHY